MDVTFLRATDGDSELLAGSASLAYEQTLQRARRTGRVGRMVVSGDAMVGLIAASRDAAMVVVGTNKTGFIRGQVFGSRSLRLASSAHCPVAVIPEPSHRLRRRIVVGVEDSPAGRVAIRFAADEAARLDEELILIAAHRPRPGASHDDTGVTARVTAAAQLITGALAQARADKPALTVHPCSPDVAGAPALIDASISSVLLVIATSGEAGAGQLDSIALDVLLNLAGPTVIVHSGD